MQGNIVSIVIISACAFFVLGCWLLYTANRTANEYHDVTDTVQSVERDNQQARQQIDSASAEIGKAEIKLNDGIKRTDRITKSVTDVKKRVDDNSKIIGECEDIVSAGRRDAAEARGIFADIDKANKVNGTQADGHAQAERCIRYTVCVVRGRGYSPEVIQNLKRAISYLAIPFLETTRQLVALLNCFTMLQMLNWKKWC